MRLPISSLYSLNVARIIDTVSICSSSRQCKRAHISRLDSASERTSVLCPLRAALRAFTVFTETSTYLYPTRSSSNFNNFPSLTYKSPISHCILNFRYQTITVCTRSQFTSSPSRQPRGKCPTLRMVGAKTPDYSYVYQYRTICNASRIKFRQCIRSRNAFEMGPPCDFQCSVHITCSHHSESSALEPKVFGILSSLT